MSPPYQFAPALPHTTFLASYVERYFEYVIHPEPLGMLPGKRPIEGHHCSPWKCFPFPWNNALVPVTHCSIHQPEIWQLLYLGSALESMMSFECLETWSKKCSNMRSKQNTSKELNIRPWSSWLLFLPHSRNLNINCGSSLDETNCRKYMTTPVPWLVYITIEWHGWIPIIVIPLPGIIQKPVLIVGFHMCDVKIHIFDQPKS